MDEQAQMEALLKALAELGVVPERQGMLQQQMQMAQQLRNTPMPQGRDLGRVFVASSPLENIATGLQRTLGMRDVRNIQGQQTGLIDRGQELRNEALQQAYRQMIGALRNRQPSQQGAPPWTPPSGEGVL